MVTKAQAENAIRHLATEWVKETGYEQRVGHYPSFSAFADWLDTKGYGHYLNSRSQIDARHVAESWFEDEIRNHFQSHNRQG